MAFRLRSNLEYKFNHDAGYLSKCENFDLGATSESSGGSRRLAKINKAPSPSSGSTSSTGSSGGKDKLKKVLCLYCFVGVFISAVTLQCFTVLLRVAQSRHSVLRYFDHEHKKIPFKLKET